MKTEEFLSQKWGLPSLLAQLTALPDRFADGFSLALRQASELTEILIRRAKKSFAEWPCVLIWRVKSTTQRINWS